MIFSWSHKSRHAFSALASSRLSEGANTPALVHVSERIPLKKKLRYIAVSHKSERALSALSERLRPLSHALSISLSRNEVVNRLIFVAVAEIGSPCI